MSFYGPGGAAHSSERDDWETPRDVFERCDEVWHFELDAASNDENALCERHFTKEQDGLKQEWGGGTRLVQSPIWSGNRKVGREGVARVARERRDRRHASSRQNGHEMVSRLLREGGRGRAAARSPEVHIAWRGAVFSAVSIDAGEVRRSAGQSRAIEGVGDAT